MKPLKSVVAVGQAREIRARLPRILLGTSPFIGAGQFGPRAFAYLQRFYDRPEEILRIIEKALELGVSGIQLLPYAHVVAAVKVAQRKLGDLTIIGTIGVGDIQADVETLAELGSTAMLVHGEITDATSREELESTLDKARQAGCLAGVAMHRPLRSLKRLKEFGIDIDIVMLPFNKRGIFMDGKPDDVLKSARELDSFLIGKKVLAAGALDPQEALSFAIPRLDCVTIGVASVEEAEKTFSIALKLTEEG